MKLLVGTVPSSDGRRLAVVLEGLRFEQATFEALQENGAAVSAGGRFAPLPADPGALGPVVQAGTTKLLLSYARPERALLTAMQEGGSPAAALQEWCREAEAMLKLWRGNRRSTLLVATDAVLRNPPEMVRALAKRFGGLIEPGYAVQPEEAGQAFDDIHQLIAAQMVVQSGEITDLLMELEAAAEPLGPVAAVPAINCESVLQQLKDRGADVLAEYEALKLKCTDLGEENELLLLQLHQVKEELESYYFRLQEKAQISNTLKQESEKATGEQRKTSERLAAREKALKGAHDEITKLKLKIRALSEEERRKHNKLRAMYDSTSWKVTKPLRFLRRLFKRAPAVGKV